MKEPVWIRLSEALAFHAQQITLFGGAAGVRDMGILESALARPKNVLAYASGKVALVDLAAAYAYGIAANHPFIDGNKRTALLVSFVFLESNGRTVTAGQEDACLMFLHLASGKMTEVELAAWFSENTSAS